MCYASGCWMQPDKRGLSMRLRSLRFVVLSAVLAPALAGCQSSLRYELYHPLGSCLTMQSVVGETADQDSAGRTPSVAFTTNRDGLCEEMRSANESPWVYFSAEARLVKRRVDNSGVFVCVVGSDVVPYDSYASEATAAASGDCGYGSYYTHGVHQVHQQGCCDFPVSGDTYSPNGYNS